MGILVLMASWEILSPRRPKSTSAKMRWLSNLGMVATGTLVLRLLLPLSGAGFALFVEKNGWGLFHALAIREGLKFVLALLCLDFAIYLQHALFHGIPIFWRLHMVHHTDLDLDATSGVRFHPIEILLSMVIKMAFIACLGVSPAAFIVFEVILNGTSLFNHGNVYLPAYLDRVLRLFVVTPDMHRVHHSVIIRETNSNFGFNLPWWDRLLGTYRAQPAAGHEDMTLGLSLYRDPGRLTLPRLLILPLTGQAGKYPALGQGPP